MALKQRDTTKQYRRTNTLVTEGDINKPVTFQFFKEKSFHERWATELYGKVKAMTGMQIGGQQPYAGSDPVQHIKQYDPKNSSGAVKEALDIMEKAQAATETGSLMSSINTLQSILGGSLYGALQKSGAAAKAQNKKQKQKKNKHVANTTANTVLTVPLVADIIDQLLAAVMAMLAPDTAVLVADLLDDAEITRIEDAYNSGQPYTSTIMPQEFIDAVNSIMPTFRTISFTGV
jgi:hypothetical protein